ncbi:MAG: glycosyltransferase family 2 protein [Aquabacterium sp.]
MSLHFLDRAFARPALVPNQQDLSLRFAASSPRMTGVRTPWRSALLHAAVLALLLASWYGMWRGQGIWTWSVGLCVLCHDVFLQALTVVQTWRLTRLQPRPDTVLPMTRLRMGVIVAAHNEERILPAALDGLLSQTRPPDQIVIADDGSTDGTARLLSARLGVKPPERGALSALSDQNPGVRWLRLAHGGKARALNQAMQSIDADFVLTVDADTLLEPRALEAMYQAFLRDPDLVAATGVLQPIGGPGRLTRALTWFQRHEYLRNFMARYTWMRLDCLLLISGAFAAFRRQPVLDVGGFDPDCLVEDYELIHRLMRHSARQGLNWTTAVVGQARACTEAPGEVMSFLRQRRRWFGGFLQTQYWYRDMVGQPRYGEVGMRMLPLKAIDTLQPFFGLTSSLVLYLSLLHRRWDVLLPVAGLLGFKTLLDLAFHGWMAHLYRRWTGERQLHRCGLGDPGRAAGAMVLSDPAATGRTVGLDAVRVRQTAMGWHRHACHRGPLAFAGRDGQGVPQHGAAGERAIGGWLEAHEAKAQLLDQRDGGPVLAVDHGRQRLAGLRGGQLVVQGGDHARGHALAPVRGRHEVGQRPTSRAGRPDHLPIVRRTCRDPHTRRLGHAAPVPGHERIELVWRRHRTQVRQGHLGHRQDRAQRRGMRRCARHDQGWQRPRDGAPHA